METPKFNKFIKFEDFTEESKPLIADYTCPLCKGIYYNPVIDMCGHIFCEKCFELHYEHKRICPIDNVPLDATPTKVRPLSMVLEKQILKCKNREFGCEWNGPLKDFQDHINKDCQRQTVLCSWIGCDASVFREDLPLHDRSCDFRVIKCEYCELQLPFNQLKQHQDLCPKFMLPCPQECGENVERESIDRHIQNSCLNTIIPCPYMKYGCLDTVIKRDLALFLNENRIKHETMTMNLIDRLVNRLDDLEVQMSNLKKITAISEQLNVLKSPFSHLVKRKREEDLPIVIEPSNVLNEQEAMMEENINQQSASLSPPIFDMDHFPHEIEVIGTKAKCFSNQKKEHKYLFAAFDIDYQDKRSVTAWSVTLLQGENWIGFGLCDKKQVIENSLKFYSSSKSFNTGTFLISSNGYTWNCLAKEEDNCFIEGLKMTERKEIAFAYDPKENKLDYVVDRLSGKLTNVFPVIGTSLTPCIVFLDVGGHIDFKYEKAQA